MAKSVNVMDYIPSSMWSDIAAYNYTTDLSIYVQAALDDSSSSTAYGEVTFPAGGFLVQNLIVYPQQYLHGAWQSTIFKQIDSESIFISSDWWNSTAHARPGRFYENLSFITEDDTAGGYAIILFSYRDQLKNIQSLGLPILCTSILKDNSNSGHDGSHVIDNLYVSFSSRGGIITTGTSTDTIITRSTFNGCGSLGGNAALEINNLAGWQLQNLRIFSCLGKVLNASHGIWNSSIVNCMIDWAGGDNIGLDFTNVQSGEQGIRLIGNDFRIKPTTTGDYTMISIHGSQPARCNHVGNKYWVDPSITGPNITAIKLQGTVYSGASGLNDYQGFNSTQIGNSELVLGPVKNYPLDLTTRL